MHPEPVFRPGNTPDVSRQHLVVINARVSLGCCIFQQLQCLGEMRGQVDVGGGGGGGCDGGGG